MSNISENVQRVDILGRQGRWREAAADASMTVQYEPAEHYGYHTIAPLLVTCGLTADYQDLCRKIVSRFADTTDPYIAERMTKDCLLTPNSGADLGTVAALAERSVTLGGDDNSVPYFQAAKALAEYRPGRFSEAAKWGQNIAQFARLRTHARLRNSLDTVRKIWRWTSTSC
jgi:hypothetical protein